MVSAVVDRGNGGPEPVQRPLVATQPRFSEAVNSIQCAWLMRAGILRWLHHL